MSNTWYTDEIIKENIDYICERLTKAEGKIKELQLDLDNVYETLRGDLKDIYDLVKSTKETEEESCTTQ